MKREQTLRWIAVVLRVLLVAGLIASFGSVFVKASAAQSGAQTYTVWVGAEDSAHGVGFERFFPNMLVIHVGDTVTWKTNSHDIHTVTFLGGEAAPSLVMPTDASLNLPSPLEINLKAITPAAPADGKYDGSSFVNSGILSKDPGQGQSFSLTFTKEGMYMYQCLVHGMAMSGEIDVVASSVSVPSPASVEASTRREISDHFRLSAPAMDIANLERQPDQRNADGTTTHYVMIGSAVGPFSLMRFFPSTVYARPGDTIVWYLSPSDMDPHTVTFLNGAKDPDLFVPFPAGSNPPQHLLFNPQVVLPSNLTAPFNNKAYTSSGLLTPGQGPQSFSLVIDKNFTGTLDYQCMLHDTSGMTGRVVVSK